MKDKKNYRFGKNQKLKSRKVIEELFTSDQIFFSYPIKCILLAQPSDKYVLPKIATVVSKRNYKRAVDRNKVKRLLREVYRLNSFDFKSTIPKDKQYNLAFIYIGKTIEPYISIEKAMKMILKKICE